MERFQQTMKKWLRAQANRAPRASCSPCWTAFVEDYNTHRPHRSLPHRRQPGDRLRSPPQGIPAAGTTTSHDRVRRYRIDTTGVVTLRVNGRLHHIGVGRTHARTPVLLLVHDLHIRVVHAATGELLRDLILDPRRDYQPTGAPKGPTRHPMTTARSPNRGFGLSPVSEEIT